MTRTTHPLLLTAAVAALALPLAACSSGSAEPTAERELAPPVVGEIETGALSGATITYAGPGGIFQDGQAEAIWAPFAEQSGATVQQDAFDTGKLKAMVDSGNTTWDVVNTSQLDTARGCGTLYEPIDLSLVDTSEVPEGTITDDCMVPNVIFGMVVAYNTEVYGENPPTSAADFFDTEKFPGKRAVSQSSYVDPQVIEFALLAQGKSLDDLEPADIDSALDMYHGLGDDVIGWTTGAQAQQFLESGEAAMGLVWSGRGFGAADAGAPIAPMWDEWMVMLDSTAIPKGAKDLQASHAAVNYYLGAEQQARMTELNSMAPVNVNAEPSLDALGTEWLSTDHMDTGTASNAAFWAEHYDALADAWAGWAMGS